MTVNYRAACLLIACAALSGCGLAGTATSTTVGAASEAQEARDAKKTEAQVQQKLDDAQRASAAQRAAAEKDSQ
jgi:hypothetical protein